MFGWSGAFNCTKAKLDIYKEQKHLLKAPLHILPKTPYKKQPLDFENTFPNLYETVLTCFFYKLKGEALRWSTLYKQPQTGP